MQGFLGEKGPSFHMRRVFELDVEGWNVQQADRMEKGAAQVETAVATVLGGSWFSSSEAVIKCGQKVGSSLVIKGFRSILVNLGFVESPGSLHRQVTFQTHFA